MRQASVPYAVLLVVLGIIGLEAGGCSTPDDCRFTVTSADGKTSGSFDLSKLCAQPHEIGGADASGARYKVNVCNQSTSLCAPRGILPSYGAVVQFFGQDVDSKSKQCTDPRTGSPTGCTAPCLVIAQWPPASFELLPGTLTNRPSGYIAHFNAMPVSPTGAFTPQCNAEAPHPRDPQPDQAGFLGVFHVSMRVECNDTAGALAVVGIQPINTSQPCDLQVQVLSQAGCPELDLGVGENLFRNRKLGS